MERITVVSRVCGCALFDWIAEQSSGGDGALWTAEQRRPTATAAIVAIFSQFAKDLGGTSVVRVRFDQPAAASTQSDAASAASSSGQPASAAAAALAASKRPSTRTFPRYGQTMHSRALFSGPGGTGGRRPTTVNGSSPSADDGPGSPVPLSSAYSASPFSPPGPAQPHHPHQPSSPQSPALPTTPTSPPSLSDTTTPPIRFDLYCADNDAVLIAVFVTLTSLPRHGTAVGVGGLGSHGDVEAACVKLRDTFQARFNSTLQQMHNTFMTMARNTDESLMNESFLSHFTAFADTMREMGYVHYVHDQPVTSETHHTAPQPTSPPVLQQAAPVLVAESNGVVISEQPVVPQNRELAVVPG